MLNIVHILEDFSFLSGGLRTVVKDLHTNLIESNINSIIITTKKEKEDDAILVKGENRIWNYSSNISEKLTLLHSKKRIDIIHIHGAWMHPQYAAAKFSDKNNIPFLITFHGMLEPWLWKKSRIKKKIYFKYFAKKIFIKAKFLHAITPMEAQELKKLFPLNDIKVIPNLINTYSNNIEAVFNKKYILYLGRLDEKKGIDKLIRAFSKIKTNNISLKIAGAFNEYKKELDLIVKELKLENKIDFLGLVVKQKKEELFKNAFVFVAPSHSEVIGMVNLEAAILQTPVITTFQTGLLKDWSKNGGFLIEPTENEILKHLKIVLKWSLEERIERGKKISDFVKKEYSWQSKLKDWINFYKTI